VSGPAFAAARDWRSWRAGLLDEEIFFSSFLHAGCDPSPVISDAHFKFRAGSTEYFGPGRLIYSILGCNCGADTVPFGDAHLHEAECLEAFGC
jgi:hypothetical protein